MDGYDAIAFYGKSITLRGNHIRGNGTKPAIGLYGVQKATLEGNTVGPAGAILLEMKPKIPYLITDGNTWELPKTRSRYESFLVDGRPAMGLAEIRNYTNHFKTDNKPELTNPTPQLPQVQPQTPAYQTNAPGIRPPNDSKRKTSKTIKPKLREITS